MIKNIINNVRLLLKIRKLTITIKNILTSEYYNEFGKRKCVELCDEILQHLKE